MVGTGKSSIIRTLTGSSDAEVGTGYRPCTATARVYEFPSEAPVIRFLDTRGLGEVAYDPAEDLALCESQAHLVLAVVKAVGPVPPAVLEALTQVRRRHPDWPVVVAQTTLHDAYTGKPHPLPYPFWAVRRSSARCAGPQSGGAEGGFRPLPGSGAVTFVPIDFTQAGDGLEPEDYGVEALWEALEAGSADGVVSMVRRSLDKAGGPGRRAGAFACLGLRGGGGSHRYAAGGRGAGGAGRSGQDAAQPCRNPRRRLDAGDAGGVFRLPGGRSRAALRHAIRRAAVGQAGAGIRHADRGSRRREWRASPRLTGWVAPPCFT